MIRGLVLSLSLALAGCNLAPDLAALAQDPNAVCITVTSLWFTTNINRNHGCDASSAR